MHHLAVLLILVIFNVVNCDNQACKSKYSCISLYSPICAFNGKIYKTFINQCELNVHNKCSKNDGRVLKFFKF